MLAELADRLGAPILAPVAEVAGLASGILRAGSAGPRGAAASARRRPPQARGYGLGFTADVPLAEA